VSDVYSVWLVPDRGSEAYHQLEEAIEEYAQLDEDAPEFEPHITVVGGISGSESVLEEGVRSLAEGQDVFDVEFAGVQCSTTRHQCVFLLVEPTAEVLFLHQEAVEVFDVDDGMYVPHLSLIYSDMDVEERLDLVESIDTSVFPSTVQIGELVLVKTTGPASEWETVARYDL
jgi:2'-5' RNA ligase